MPISSPKTTLRRPPRIAGMLVSGMLLLGQCGCAQYLGYHYRNVTPADAGPDAGKASQRVRVYTYGRYSVLSDLILDPYSWICTPIGMAVDFWQSTDFNDCSSMLTYEWGRWCVWPPVDLLFRLCGSSGFNDMDYGPSAVYDGIRPPYWRRVAQWWGWVLPGYTLMHGETFERIVEEPVVAEPSSR